MQQIIKNQQHYDKVIQKVYQAKKTIWIGTADIKDLHVKDFKSSVSFLSVLNKMAQQRVNIRILHAKEPGPNFKRSFSKYPFLKKNIEMQKCPRVHFKMIIIDSSWAYFGSANLTGAGLGMKSENNRNFETGLISNDANLVNELINQFDRVWIGLHCENCGRREYCDNPII